MKTIEQKAKAYDEALKVLHKYDGANIMFSQDLKEEMFPELKESEDERIKEWLINLVKGHIEWLEDRIREQLSNGQVYGGELVKAKNSLAWLEKQGEKPTDEEMIETLRIEYEKGKSDVIAEMQKPAWSQEDERIYQSILDDTVQEYQLDDKQLDWLKSIKDRYTWKPSEEQMKALLDSIPENVKEISEREMLLDSLYQDLKKLKRE